MIDQVLKYGRMIKFSHSVFALPYAFVAIILSYSFYPHAFTWQKFLWITIAMVSARSTAMGFNRLVDRNMDAKNPRTKERALPRGEISLLSTYLFVFIFSVIFVFSASRLNNLAFALSPLALLIINGYSYTKRFTRYTHLLLGLGLGLAPLGAWIAVVGKFDLLPVILAAAVMFWVAGFDIIYSCQDYQFDMENQVYSIPVGFGIAKALQIARLFHILAAFFFVGVGIAGGQNWIYFSGLSLIFILMVYQHGIVSEKDLTRVDMAFFNLNGIISLLYLIVIIISNYFGG